MDLTDIRSLVPHSDPMLWLDRVVGYGEDWLEAEGIVRPDHPLIGDRGIGAWVGIEYLGQAVAAYAGVQARLKNEPVKPGFLVGTRRYESLWPIFPAGACLRVRVHLTYSAENGLAVFDGRICCDGADVVIATLSVYQPTDPEEFLRGAHA